MATHDERYDKESHYIIAESQEIDIGESEGLGSKLKTAFPAFNHKNYQLYFFGQAVSLSGTWMQTVALGWLVFSLTHSAYMVGVVTALGTLPVLLFGLFGGVIVDRFPKKQLLILTQCGTMVISLLLGVLTVTQHISVEIIGLLAFLSGIFDAIDKPGRQAFMVEIVGKEDLASAIALNSGLFNGARVVGPAIAGILIGLYGPGQAFLINALSFIAVIIALLLIKTTHKEPASHPHPFTALKEGLAYVYNHTTIRLLLLFVGISSVFGWSYTTLMPVIVETVYHLDAFGLGYFYAANGVGAVVGTFVVSAFSKKINPLVFVLGGNAIFGLSLLLFTFSSSLLFSLFCLFLAGFGLLMQFATMNTTIQHLVSHKVRGRVMSIYTLMFIGLSPLGSYQIGFIAQHFGVLFAIQLNVCILLFFGSMYVFLRKQLQLTYIE